MYLYMYVCVYIYIYVYIYIHTHTYRRHVDDIPEEVMSHITKLTADLLQANEQVITLLALLVQKGNNTDAALLVQKFKY